MAAASVELGFRNARSKKRRHSYSSARAFAARPSVVSQTAHFTSSLKRSGSLLERNRRSSSSDLVDSELPRTGRRSFSKFLFSRRKKSSLTTASTATSSTSTESESQDGVDYLTKQKGEYVRVMASVLHPQIVYKTLSITKLSTVYEVVVKLVSRFALSQEDRDNPDVFYLTEVRESEQGSYSRVLENSDRVYDIQSRWRDGRRCSFTLCRKETLTIEDDPFHDSPLEAIVMSPSQDYFETGFAGVVGMDVPSVPTSPNSYDAKTSFFSGPTSWPLPPTPLPTSPSEQSTDEVFFDTKEISRTHVAPPTETTPPTVDVGRLMQQSVSGGMLGVMTRIITEGASPRQRRATISNTTSPRQQDMMLRPLLQSPAHSDQKNYPEFIFTPKITGRPSSAGGQLMVPRLTLDETASKHKTPPLCRATHTLSSVRFSVECVFHPRYRSTASLYPSFSRSTLFTTAMDLTHSVYNMLQNQLNPTLPKHTLSPVARDEDTPKQSELNLKRPHTFHVRRDHLQLHLQDSDGQLPSYRDHLVERAAKAIRKRHSESGVGLTGGGGLTRADSCTTVSHTSTVSIGSEVETDLDSLRDLGGHNNEHSLSSLPPHVRHRRTESDGLYEMRAQTIHRGLSSGSIQTTGLDSAQCTSLSQKVSDSYLTRHKTMAEQVRDSGVYNSAEAVNGTAESRSSDEDEVLYTFQNNLRPVTVLVRSRSSHTLEEWEGPRHSARVTSRGRRVSDIWTASQQKPQEAFNT